MTDIEIITSLIEYYKMSTRRFSEFLELKSPQILYDILKNRNGISKDLAHKIKAKCLNINMDWLLTGKGEMFNSEKNEKTQNTTIEEKAVEYMMLPIYNIDAVGGISNSIVDSSQYIAGYLPMTNARSGDLCISISGDSMMPQFVPGSYIQIRKIDMWREYLDYNKVYVIELNDDRRLIKEIRKSDEKDKFILHSYNEYYEDNEIPKSFIRAIWCVVCKLERMIL